jgi:ribosomal protein L24
MGNKKTLPKIRLPKVKYRVGDGVYIKTGKWKGCYGIVEWVKDGLYTLTVIKDGKIEHTSQNARNITTTFIER